MVRVQYFKHFGGGRGGGWSQEWLQLYEGRELMGDKGQTSSSKVSPCASCILTGHGHPSRHSDSDSKWTWTGPEWILRMYRRLTVALLRLRWITAAPIYNGHTCHGGLRGAPYSVPTADWGCVRRPGLLRSRRDGRYRDQSGPEPVRYALRVLGSKSSLTSCFHEATHANRCFIIINNDYPVSTISVAESRGLLKKWQKATFRVQYRSNYVEAPLPSSSCYHSLSAKRGA